MDFGVSESPSNTCRHLAGLGKMQLLTLGWCCVNFKESWVACDVVCTQPALVTGFYWF